MSSLFRQAIVAIAVSSAFSAHAASTELAPVVVTATRQETRANELLSDVTVIDRQQIEQTGQGSIIDLLSRQAGIQTVQNGGPGTNAQLYLRGARSDATKILVDGVPINSVDLTGSPLRFLSLADVDRIEVLRGPASSLYGADAVGGVIQIFTRRGEPGLRANAYAGFGSYGAQKFSTGVSGGNEMWRFNLQGHEERMSGFSAVRNARNQDADNDSYSNLGSNGSISLLPAAGHEIGLTWMNSHGQVFYDGTTGTGTYNSRSDFSNQNWALSSKNRITENWTSTLRYGQSIDDQSNYTSAAASGFSPLRTETTQTSWQNDIGLPLGKGLFLVEHTEQNASPQSRFPGQSDITTNAALLGWNAQAGAHSWQLSTRHDDHSQFGVKNTWAAAYGYRISDEWHARAGAGTSFKAPTLYQLYIPTFGNAALTPETGKSEELGLNWDHGVHAVAATWYRTHLNNMIDFVGSQYQNITKATLEGWTFTYAGKFADWDLGGSIDLLDASNDGTGKKLSRRAKEKMSLFANRDWGVWNTGLELISVGQRYNTDVETQVLGGYTLLNATARYTINKSWSADFRANNITDKRYATANTGSASTLPGTQTYDYSTLGASYFVGVRYQMQ